MARVIRIDRGWGGAGFRVLGGIRFHLMRDDVRGLTLDLFGMRIRAMFYPGMRGHSSFNDWNAPPPWNDVIIEFGPFRIIVGRAYSGYLANG